MFAGGDLRFSEAWVVGGEQSLVVLVVDGAYHSVDVGNASEAKEEVILFQL